MVRPAFRAPSSQEGEAFLAKLGRITPRDREAVSALVADDFEGLFDIRIRIAEALSKRKAHPHPRCRPSEGWDPEPLAFAMMVPTVRSISNPCWWKEVSEIGAPTHFGRHGVWVPAFVGTTWEGAVRDANGTHRGATARGAAKPPPPHAAVIIPPP